ncbi:uncharacterized protein LOC117117609 [Anneissia japonica]|uniref:uncharacterized protein LOC117117609 n=1 Tax=Anneissia japonica TaxID=1529436 RepID=UPI00142594AB|nr:uncharacterized protein LOC117117609 [Anneissia japonica]
MLTKCRLLVLLSIYAYGCVGQQSRLPKDDELVGTPKMCDRAACYIHPSKCIPEENCEYALSVKETSDRKSFKFNLRGKTDGFVAIGLSRDKILGNDDMVACVLNGSNVEVRHIYGEYSKMHTNELDAGATVSKASYDAEHGIIHCVFTRKKILKYVPQYFNTKRKWYLIFARGSVKNGTPLLHVGPQKNEDDTVFCIISKAKDNADIKHAYTGRHYIQEISAAENINVHSVSAVDGYISCKFSRRKVVPDNNKMFNLYQPHFMFLASGPVTSTIQRPMQHSTTPLISEHLVNFTSTRGIITLDVKPTQESVDVGVEHDGKEHHPYEQVVQTEFIGPPGLRLLPDKTAISYRPSMPASYMKFVRLLTAYIPNSNTHLTCNPDTKFGYASGDPCFIIKFTENSEKWAPLPYPPIPLPHTIKNIYDDTHLPVTCDGKTNADKRAIGAIIVTPSAGFLSADLQDSFVTVQLMNPTENVPIRIVCYIWAANIDHSQSEGRIDFLVKVKGPV